MGASATIVRLSYQLTGRKGTHWTAKVHAAFGLESAVIV